MIEERNKVGRPLKWEDAEDLEKQIDEFFGIRKKEGLPPTLEGLAYHLNVNRQTILNYEKKDGFAEVIDRAKLKIADIVMSNALIGEYNPTIAIWVSKNHYGYRDKVEQENVNYNREITIADISDEDIIRYNAIIDAERQKSKLSDI